MDFQTKNNVVWDIEVYKNFFLAGFQAPDGTIIQCESVPELARTVQFVKDGGYNLVGFNSQRYDDPVASVFLTSGDTLETYTTSVSIITKESTPWNYIHHIESLDIMPLLPERMSLKHVGIRLKHEKLQELPVAYDKELTEAEKQIIREYNVNDLMITRKLLNEIQPELDLRGDLSRQYWIDLRSKGDAGIAEVVISREVGALSDLSARDMKDMARQEITDNPFVTVPFPTWWQNAVEFAQGPWLSYLIATLSGKFNTSIPINDKGRLQKGALDSIVFLNDVYYKLGLGGLHSIDGKGMQQSFGGEFLIDVDVASYYPAIMLTQNLFPRHIQKHFKPVFKSLVDQRLTAKKAKNMVTADRLKITINGTYGKTSDPFSALYDPQCTAGVTVTGQVSLLILIAMLADVGIQTVSANTDGVTVKGTDKNLLTDTVSLWENLTGFDMEYTNYRATYQLDVNNYIAVKTNGVIKARGRFVTAPAGKFDLRHSLMHNVCAIAVKEFIQHSVPVEDTIRTHQDINNFLITHAATGEFKCYWKQTEIGKLVRFYKSTSTWAEPIIKATSEKKQLVPMSENCIPVQDLPIVLPDDINYQWYIDKALTWLNEITQPKNQGMNERAYYMQSIGLTPAALLSDPSARASRAYIEPGGTDWNALPEDREMGISTGRKAGVVAVVNNESGKMETCYKFTGALPPKTRETSNKKSGTRIIYGANVHLDPSLSLIEVKPLPDGMLSCWYGQYYTKSELKKVGIEWSSTNEEE